MVEGGRELACPPLPVFHDGAEQVRRGAQQHHCVGGDHLLLERGVFVERIGLVEGRAIAVQGRGRLERQREVVLALGPGQVALGQGLAYGAQVQEVVVVTVVAAFARVAYHGLLRTGAAVTPLRGRHRRQGGHDGVDRLAVVGQVFAVTDDGGILTDLVQSGERG